MKIASRRKVRNCIRKDTFRYYFEDDYLFSKWNKIQEVFGQAIKWPEIDIVSIENDRLIIRRSEHENSFTLIKKKQFEETDEKILHEIIGLID